MSKNRNRNAWISKGLVFGALVMMFVATLASVGVVAAEMGDIVASFGAPPGVNDDLAWDGKFLWGVGNDKIYKIDTKGDAIASFDCSGIEALTYDGKYLWGAGEDGIYKLDTNGNLIATFQFPDNYHVPVTAHIRGLTYDGEYLWCYRDLIVYASPSESKLLKLDVGDSDVSIISEIDMSSPYNGLAWDGKYLWGATSGDRKIYKFDTNCNPIASFHSPGEYAILGLTCDGKYLWCLSYDAYIYKVDIGKAAPSERDSSEGVPGFESIFAIAGLLAVVYLLRRRK